MGLVECAASLNGITRFNTAVGGLQYGACVILTSKEKKSAQLLSLTSLFTSALQRGDDQLQILHQAPDLSSGVLDCAVVVPGEKPALAYGVLEGGFEAFSTKKNQLFAYAFNVLRANNPCIEGAPSSEASNAADTDGCEGSGPEAVIKCERSLLLLGVYLQFKSQLPIQWTLVAYYPVAELDSEHVDVVLDSDVELESEHVKLASVVLGAGPVATSKDLIAPLAALKLCAENRGWPSPVRPDLPINIAIDRSCGTAYKVYHSESSSQCRPNSHLFADVFHATVVESPYSRHKLSVLQYTLVDGRPNLTMVSHAMSLVSELRRLKKLGVTHGDVRGANIVCCPDGLAYLIDYDFAGESGVATYPDGYICEGLPDVDRHPDAEAGSVMKYEHDRFALHSIFKRYRCCTSDATHCAIWEECVDALVSGASLKKTLRDKFPRIKHLDLSLKAGCVDGAESLRVRSSSGGRTEVRKYV